MSEAPLYLVAGARPNFIKLAPLVRSLRLANALPFEIVHTGQHYDYALSESFFQVLELPRPNINLEVGSGPQGAQTARILERFEALLLDRPPRAVVVFGDVTSTLACSLAAVKLGIPVAHVEAGLRSFDRTMPEEINRLLTDAVADLLLVSEPSGLENLRREGVPEERVHLVGNIMIDTLELMLPAALARRPLHRCGLEPGGYALLTLHRPANVDDSRLLSRLLAAFCALSERLPILFPAHPRTLQRIQELGFPLESCPGLRVVEPLDYLDALHVQKHARLVLTDSGGMQEETTHLGVPCLTLRENTERPITLTHGTAVLVGRDPARIQAEFERVLAGGGSLGQPIPLWDGQAAGRIAALLAERYA